MCALQRICILITLCLSTACMGQARHCLQSIVGDGHPIFGAISTRLDREDFLGTPTCVQVADLNGDGIPDVAVTLMQRDVVAVAFGVGDGRFRDVAYYATGATPIMLTVADFTGDDRQDIAAINQIGNTVSVLLNNGDGTFAPAVHFPVGPRPRSIAAGDLTGNGLADLVVLNVGDQTVSVLKNMGAGNFAPEVRVNPGFTTTTEALPGPGPHVVLGDFNGNGRLDLVVPQQYRILVMLNDGSGNFAPGPTALLNESHAYAMAAADLNGDQRMDLAVVTSRASAQTLHILLNTGDGTFHPAQSYDAAPKPPPGWFFTALVAAADLGRNGHMDLVVGHEWGYGFATILRNRGDGTFHPKEVFATDWDSQAMAVQDLDGDGYPDWLITGAYIRAVAKVLLNDRSGRSMAVSTHPVGARGHMGIAADLNRSGRMDLVIASNNPFYHLSVARNDGGSFTPFPPIALGPPYSAKADSIAVADLNGDMIPDLVVSDVIDGSFITHGKVHVLFGLGDFQYAAPVPYMVPGFPGRLAIADFNRNGHRDIAVWICDEYPGDDVTPVPRRLLVLINDGSGGFSIAGNYILESLPWVHLGELTAADIDGDTHPDLIAGWGSRDVPGRVGFLRNRGDGTFDPPQVIETSRMPRSIIAGDLRGLGRVDVAVMHNLAWWTLIVNYSETPYLTILHNDGAGGFPTRQEFIDTGAMTDGQMSAADLTGDGFLDLILPNLGGRGVIVHLNRGDGAFQPGQQYAGSNTLLPSGTVAADFDGDGRADVAVMMPLTVGHVNHYISMLRNVGCRPAPCYANCDGSTIEPILNVDDFTCFINTFAAASALPQEAQVPHYANCDGSTTAPVLNVDDFTCFISAFAQGCR